MSVARQETITVLHVDDEPQVSQLAADFLERIDDRFEVETAESPQEGLDRLEADDIDCVVSDYEMPGTDGLEFLQRVREEFGELPFVLFTGRGSEAVASEAISAGVTDYLQKETGTEQYELLANRLSNAVEQHRATREAVELDRIRRVLRDVNQALVRSDSREEIERRVCEIIADARPYQFAWIGNHDEDRQVVEPRAWAGVEDGYLDSIEITTDDSETGQGPTGRAIRERAISVMQNIPEDPDYEPWREQALERGYRSSAAVPLYYDDTLYGVLNVYADRTYAFDERERELLRELAGDIVHAIYRAELRLKQDRYERIVENLPVGVYRSTPEGRIVQANPAVAEIFGGDSVEEVLDRDVTEFYTDPAVREELTEALSEEAAIHQREERQETIDGDEIWASITAIETEADGDRYFDGIIQDVTERKHRERELRRRTAHLEQAQEIANFGSWQLDLEEDSLYWSDQVYRIFEVPPDESLSYEDFLDFVHPEDREYVDRQWNAALEGAPYDIEHRILVDGTTKWVRERAELEFDDDGTPVSGIGVVVDITEQKERESELLEFADVLAHDVPNHLGVADGAIELARGTGDLEHLERAEAAHDRIDTLLEEMAGLVRASTPVQTVEPVDLGSIAEAGWGSCCSEHDPAALEILADIEVKADESRLRQLFENLFWNACDHAGSDATVEIGLLEDGFYVADDGPGIPEDRREEIFSPGYTMSGDGHSGFGLAIVKQIAEAHDWTIDVTDSDRGGARFEFRDVEFSSSE